MCYMGGKARIATQISNYINNLGGVLPFSISEGRLAQANKYQGSLITHTHTHTV
jgi:hypothetical protein